MGMVTLSIGAYIGCRGYLCLYQSTADVIVFKDSQRYDREFFHVIGRTKGVGDCNNKQKYMVNHYVLDFRCLLFVVCGAGQKNLYI